MTQFRKYLINISTEYHMQIHLLIGVFLGVSVNGIFGDASNIRVLTGAILGSFLPDLDHFLFLYGYGRATPYAITVKKLLKNHGLRTTIDFCKVNHKHNTQILSHNILFVVSAFGLSIWFLQAKDSVAMFTFMLAWFLHYMFDICEDYLFFGRVNSNWFLKFKEKYRL